MSILQTDYPTTNNFTRMKMPNEGVNQSYFTNQSFNNQANYATVKCEALEHN